MASFIQPISGIAAQASPQTAKASASAVADKNMFLQLLVAQLRNQNPLNPSDGTQFVAQLAQFQQVESSLNMGQDITAMRQDLDQILATKNSSTVPQS